MKNEPVIRDVSETSLWVAAHRAAESRRPDALFRDPFAELLAGERGRTIARKMQRSYYTAWSVVIRTCIIDSLFADLVSRGIDTVVNLGAGVDTRPYRLKLPAKLNWVEVDYPHIIALKEQRLQAHQPVCHLRRIALDLSDRSARTRLFAELAGGSQKTAVLTEGVLPYLTNEQVAELAADLRAQPPFQYWIADYYAPQVMRYLLSQRRMKQMGGAPFQFQPGDWFAFFSEKGWSASVTRYLGEESVRLGRPVPAPWWVNLLRRLTPASKRKIFSRLTAYVLLEQSKVSEPT